MQIKLDNSQNQKLLTKKQKVIKSIQISFLKLKELWSSRKTLGEKDNIKKDAYSFLPGVLEVTDQPPHPLMRRILYYLIILIVFLVIWASICKIDIITTAQGKIIPTGDVKTIQSSEKGTVVKINVLDGQLVHKDDVLMVLESDYTEADINKLKADIKFYKLRISREQTFYKMIMKHKKEQISFKDLKYTAPKDITNELDIEESKRLLWQEWQSVIAKLMTLKATLASKKHEKIISENRTKQLEETILITKQRLNTYETLYKKQAVSKMDYLNAKEEYITEYYQLENENKIDDQLDASIVEAKSNLESFKSETYLNTLKAIRKDKQDLYIAKQELKKAITLNEKNIIKSPIDGVVHEKQIDTIGAIVTPAQILMQIVPLDEKLEAEVFVKNEDIGYLKKGQTAEIKVNTFPFTEYGVLTGKLKKISGDAIEDERLGLVYKLIITLNNNTLYKDKRPYKIVPGMAVVAEIKTGKRKVIQFFTEPLTRGINESLRER